MSDKRKIKYMRLDQIRLWDENPRRDQDVDSVAHSIKEFGFNQPIVVDQSGVVCVGNTRFMAAKQLGLEEVPVIQLEMTRATFVQYALADNRTGERSDWDGKKLVSLLEELAKDQTIDLKGTDFDLKELTAMIAQPFKFDGELVNTEEKQGPTTRPPTNKGEINLDQLGDELKHECPRCNFRF